MNQVNVSRPVRPVRRPSSTRTGLVVCVPAAVSCRRLCSQHAPLQLAGHDLALLLQLPRQSLKLELL